MACQDKASDWGNLCDADDTDTPLKPNRPRLIFHDGDGGCYGGGGGDDNDDDDDDDDDDDEVNPDSWMNMNRDVVLEQNFNSWHPVLFDWVSQACDVFE